MVIKAKSVNIFLLTIQKADAFKNPFRDFTFCLQQKFNAIRCNYKFGFHKPFFFVFVEPKCKQILYSQPSNTQKIHIYQRVNLKNVL